MIVLSDEPKAIVSAAEQLRKFSNSIAEQYSVDQLAFKINDFIRELRNIGESGSYMGTSGFLVLYFFHEEDGEEVRVMLDVLDLHRYPDDDTTQQFVNDNTNKWEYDESCPDEWKDEDNG